MKIEAIIPWALFVLAMYPFLLYPLLVRIIGLLTTTERFEDPEFDLPHVTVVIAAFNEEKVIVGTVLNKLEQDYPAHKLDVLVVSDCSTDKTDTLLTQLEKEQSRVRFLRQKQRQGKTCALNLAVKNCQSYVVVFSDANSEYAKESISALVSRFSDPTIGYVTGRMTYRSQSNSATEEGCSAYMKYENTLRKWENNLGSVVGVDGGIDAIRRELYTNMRESDLPDFVLPLSVVRQGYRVVYEPAALIYEDALSDISSEYKMRVRVASRAIRALSNNLDLANPFRYGVFAWQMISHKWARYLSVIPLVLAGILAFWHYDSSLACALLLWMYVVGGVLSLLALISPKQAGRVKIVRWCLYFLVLNLSSLVALKNVAVGRKFTIWSPRTG